MILVLFVIYSHLRFVLKPGGVLVRVATRAFTRAFGVSVVFRNKAYFPFVAILIAQTRLFSFLSESAAGMYK
jgi:hypothetical protein